MDHIISSLKSLLLNPGSELVTGTENHSSSLSAWMDGASLTCFDRPLAPHAENQHNTRNSKTVPVEELVGFLLSYLKDCAEDYLTRRPMKEVNVIDGSQVETKTTITSTTASTIPLNSSGKEDEAIAGLRAEVKRVVLGVPVNCTERSKRSLKNAAELAGFTEVHFLAESTAAATAYGLTVSGTKQVLIFDMGGGTTDLSIMHIQNGTLSVQSTGGNNELGGKNIDAALLELVERKAKSLDDQQIETFQQISRAHLLQLCRQCKEELSALESSSITIPYHPAGPNTSNADMTIEITREEFQLAAKPITDLVEATVYHMVQNWQLQQQHQQQQQHLQLREKVVDNGSSTVGPAVEEDTDTDGFVQVSTDATTLASGCKEAAASLFNAPVPATSTSEPTDAPVLSKSGDLVFSIDEVVLVGGSSRVPCVRAALRRALGRAGITAFAPDGPKELCTSLNPEEVVAEGLAIRGAVLSGVSTGKLKELLMMDCVNNAIGVMTWEASERANNSSLSADSTNVDTPGTRIFNSILHKGMPIPAKNTLGGIGAANNSSLSADSTNVDTPGTRIFNSILHKGMPIPAKNTMRFPLADPNQKFVSLDIFEEVEECKRKSETNASKEIVDYVGDFEMTYTYHVVATADIAVPMIHSVHSSDTGAVDITFTMTSDGMLRFNVVRVEDPVHGDAKTNMSSIYMLIVYIAVMIALYLFVKITLTEAEVTSVRTDSMAQGVNTIEQGIRHTVVGDNAASNFDDSVIPSATQAVNNAVVDALGEMHL
eukprot:CAMPEP_0185013096 /NCGR_PEP_ID=MMETSP1098-20130426/98635_1 /TAXON_ID=89044 /ORGANISM="Spumella elongata, Strain CCAP 955/1" /LENGTH=770 /DNA_ID=CAMNT_0027542161 /DNA_START=108 /DNA_END=2421 /DNA_ORIENTATION=+